MHRFAALALFVPGGGLVAALTANLSQQGSRRADKDGRAAIVCRVHRGDFGQLQLQGWHGWLHGGKLKAVGKITTSWNLSISK
jgi:hypothetical protein